MTEKRKPLADRISELVKRELVQTTDDDLSVEAQEALKLAEKFSYLEPEPYILPLDTVVGLQSENTE